MWDLGLRGGVLAVKFQNLLWMLFPGAACRGPGDSPCSVWPCPMGSGSGTSSVAPEGHMVKGPTGVKPASVLGLPLFPQLTPKGPPNLGEQAQWELGAGISRPDIPGQPGGAPHLSPSRVGLWALCPISGCMYPLAEGGEGVQAVLILGGVAHLGVITAASLQKVKGGKGRTVEDIRDSVHISTKDR